MLAIRKEKTTGKDADVAQPGPAAAVSLKPRGRPRAEEAEDGNSKWTNAASGEHLAEGRDGKMAKRQSYHVERQAQHDVFVIGS